MVQITALQELASEDEAACAELCGSEIIETLRDIEDFESFAAGCTLLETAAAKSSEEGKVKLG